MLRVCIVLLTLLLLFAPLRSQRPPSLPSLFNCVPENVPIIIKLEIYNESTLVNTTKMRAIYTPDDKIYEQNIIVNIEIANQNNLTLVATLWSESENKIYATSTKNLTRYSKIRSANSQGHMTMELGVSDQSDVNYALHIPVKFSILMLFDQQALHPRHESFTLLNYERHTSPRQDCYVPLIDLSQMHIPFKTYVPLISQNKTAHEIKFTLQVYPINYYIMFLGLTNKEFIKKANPLMADIYDDATMDTLKEVLFGNSFYLVVGYFLLSLTESLMQIFAFKEEIKVWKSIEKNVGLSIKSLYQTLVCEVIVCLYLHNADASNFYLFFQVLSLVMTLWKLTRALDVSFSSKNRFYLRISYKEWYHRKVETSDTEAMHYTTYLVAGLYAVFMIYKLYGPFMKEYDYYLKNEELLYPSLRQVYSFFLESSVGFIFIFGFVMMTPQLYINYKLKSVDHLPWKTLIYRFIATIIDDIFVFMVDVPAMTRAFSFRDDIIFVGYLIQRRMYRVDKKRLAVSTGSINLGEQKLGGQQSIEEGVSTTTISGIKED